MKVAVVGAGTMGSSVAQLAAMHGHEVRNIDVDQPSLERARASVDRSLERFVRAGRVEEAGAERVVELIDYGCDLGAGVGDAEVVIESVVEQLEVKRAVLREAALAAPSSCLLGTNTSQLSITAIAAGVPEEAAERVIGMHFFNPPVLMRLLEVTRGQLTADDTVARTEEFGLTLDREVVILAKDVPGFVTTRISAAVRLECLRILEEGVASAEDIDRACKLGLNFPMGPLELGDFNGLDTFLAAVESLEASHGSRYHPPAVLRNMVMAGQVGRKAGRGFYRYGDDGRRLD
ncbi:MAG: 3-hydroxyacyl-CoA dehydrogenase family protein [Actinobacteria bacterium]|nr:3-hydroxyacyl-CoA dehydrogenase family protein [Actinomycetota bacterium]